VTAILAGLSFNYIFKLTSSRSVKIIVIGLITVYLGIMAMNSQILKTALGPKYITYLEPLRGKTYRYNRLDNW
jgi:hypothetical protein